MKRCPVLITCAALGAAIKQWLASWTVFVVILGTLELLLLILINSCVLAPFCPLYLADSHWDQADWLWVVVSNCCLRELGSLGERDFRVNVFAEQRQGNNERLRCHGRLASNSASTQSLSSRSSSRRQPTQEDAARRRITHIKKIERGWIMAKVVRHQNQVGCGVMDADTLIISSFKRFMMKRSTVHLLSLVSPSEWWGHQGPGVFSAG